MKWGDAHEGGMSGRFDSTIPVSGTHSVYEEKEAAAAESITQWAFEVNLEVFGIVYAGDGSWMFSVVETGKAGGWTSDLIMVASGEIRDMRTGKVYREATNAKG